MRKYLTYLTLILFLFGLQVATKAIAMNKPVWSYKEYSGLQSLRIIENKGQVTDSEGRMVPDVKFYMSNGNATIYFTKNKIIYSISTLLDEKNHPDIQLSRAQSAYPHRDNNPPLIQNTKIEIELVGANSRLKLVGEEEFDEVLNFYYSHCPNGITGVKTYNRILYKNIYPKVDLLIYATGEKSSFKYDFIVHPGGNPARIKLRYNGADNITANADGSINFDYNSIRLTEQKPYVYQKSANSIKEIEATFELNNNTVGFLVEKYDKKKKLIIDPVIHWSTYYGGSDGEHSSAIALDNQANVIIGGRTLSRNFPVSNSTVYVGEFDLFIAKFDYLGKRIWATYYGSRGADYLGDLIVDAAAHIYITGWTWDKNFPVTVNCFQPVPLGGQNEGILARFNRNGNLEWSTYLGGSSDEHLYALATDNKSNLFVAGWSKSSNYPNNITPLNPKGLMDDIVLSCFTTAGEFKWSTFLGGDSIETADGLKIDYNGNVVLVGTSFSRNFPVTSDAYQRFNNGFADVVLARYTPNGVLLNSTYLGGKASDYGTSLALDSLNNIFICGYTLSKDFPTTDEAFQKTSNGLISSFVTKLSSFSSLSWSTYLGGSKEDQAFAIAVDRSGEVVITGKATSNNFPVTNNAYQQTLKGTADAFGAKFSNAGDIIYWITLYGGDDEDFGTDLEVDYYHNIYITGNTRSRDFPISDDAYQKNLGGLNDAFIIKHCATSPYSNISINGKSSFCEGESVELDAGEGFLFYEWSTGETSRKINAKKAGFYTCLVTDSMYCDFTTPPVLITVYPTPKPKIAGNIRFCEGDSAVLSVPSGYVSHEWSTGSKSPTIAVKKDMTIILKVIDSNGCVGYDTALVRQYPRPKPMIHGPAVVCAYSQNVTYYVYGQAGHTYDWDVDGGVIVGGGDYFNVRIDWLDIGKAMIRIKQYDNVSGCYGEDSLLVSVSDHLEPMILSNKGNFYLCEGETMELDAGPGYKDYLWFDGSTKQKASVNKPGMYWVKVMSDGNCVGYDTIEVISRPVVNPVIIGDTAFCQLEKTTLLSSIQGQGYLHTWDVNNAKVIQDDSTSAIELLFDNAGDVLVKLVVIDTLGKCKSDTISFSAHVLSSPIATIKVDGPTKFCEGDSVILSVKDSAGIRILWNTGDTTNSIVVQSSGTYSVALFNMFDCSDTASIDIEVWPLPAKPSISIVEDTLISSSGDSYEWYRNDTLLVSEQGQKLYTKTDGVYKVVHTNTFGCSEESDTIHYKYIPIFGLSSIFLSDTLFVETGDTISIPLIITASKYLNKLDARKFTAYISFYGNILIPENEALPFTMNGDKKTVILTGERNNDTLGLLTELVLIVALGDSVCTDVTLDSLNWDVPDINVIISNTVVCITNICPADGNRFFINSGNLRLESSVPNPAYDLISITYETIETGYHSLVLYDIYGRSVAVLHSGNISAGIHNVEFNTKTLASGIYYYVLQTPSVFLKKNLQIVK